VLRVDELGKPGGVPCRNLRSDGPGCDIHPTRPEICRRYRCLWLQGGLEEEDRPDRLGAVLDLLTEAGTTHLAVREVSPGAFERAPRLRAIAERYRAFLPVRITDTRDVMDPDAPVRLLLPDGEERRVEGEWVSVFREGRLAERRRLPASQRLARRVLLRVRRWRLERVRRRAAQEPAGPAR
jgi:Fe-S-cluster containining protein